MITKYVQMEKSSFVLLYFPPLRATDLNKQSGFFKVCSKKMWGERTKQTNQN